VVLLVRHGVTPTTGKVLPGRARGLHLAPEGHAQADAVAARIASLSRRPVALYASPLERTKETAKPIGEALGLRVTTDRGLLECDFGEWTGKELAALSKLPAWNTVQRWPSGFTFPGGESFAAMSTRISATVARIAAAHAGQTVVAVSHADPIKAAVAWAGGVPLDLFQRFVVSPCSVSAIALSPAGANILCVNSTASLSELALS